MASVVLSPDTRFRPGTTLYVYPATSNARPRGASITSAVVAADSTITFTDLVLGERYVAGTSDTGPFVSFQPDPPAAGTSGVDYVPTDADLPATSDGHPVMLVLEDSTALNAQDEPQPTLRYWTGSAWRIIGLAGSGSDGGTVTSDFIDVPASLAGMSSGRTIIWSDDQFIPGALS